MRFSDRFMVAFKALLPAPFTIAVLLTVVTFVIAWFATVGIDPTIETTQTEIATGDSVTLTASKGKSYTWYPGESTAKSITVSPTINTTYSVVVQDTVGNYKSLATQKILVFASGQEVHSKTEDSIQSVPAQWLQLLGFWEDGLWTNGLLVFALQMMLMLVLGHVLALSKPVNRLILAMVQHCNTTANAAFLVTFLTVAVSLFNWGLGLIFGAIFARKVAEYAVQLGLNLNYALIGASGYSGLMVWHGGISGSSLTKVAEPGHLSNLMADILPAQQLAALPNRIGFEDTVFSNMNITVSIALLVILPLAMYFIGKRGTAGIPVLKASMLQSDKSAEVPTGAERLDHSFFLALFFGGVILLYAFYKAFILPTKISLDFINPNFINLTLLGLGIVLHGNFSRFIRGVEEAIGGAAGILIQFPLYFGIMGIMSHSGLVNQFSQFFVSISTEVTYPIYTFFSAGIVNVFVPSGGGQWGVQGPIIVKAAQELGVPLNKSIMALAYGDQLTNMLQPFWALPLLGITGLKAKEILPYTLFLMLIGMVIFIAGLLVF
jgi:short-chain fatty acids transporter